MKLVVGLVLLLQALLLPCESVAGGGSTPCLTDRWGYKLTATNAKAVEAYNEAVLAYATLSGDVVGNIQKASSLDPEGFLMPHIYLGFIYLLSTGVTAQDTTVQAAIKKSREIRDKVGSTPREDLYMEAVDHLVEADFESAVQALEAILADHSKDLLAVRASHDAYILLGDPTRMRESIGRVMGLWEGEPAVDLYIVNSMLSFATEEAGDYRRAWEFATSSLVYNPKDATALHAAAHVLEMNTQVEEAEELFETHENKWDDATLFRNHVAWHRALVHLYKGQFNEALQLYDTYLVRDQGAKGPDTPLGLSDASALLWRMGTLMGQPVGKRWEQLLQYWLPHLNNHVTSFNDMHMMMCLVHSSNTTYRDSALGSMRALAHGPTTKSTNQGVLNLVGLNVVEGLVAFHQGDYKKTIELLHPVRRHWLKIGGSHAQRDVIMLTLLEACMRNDTDLPLALRLLAERMVVKDPDNQGGTSTNYIVVLDKIAAQKLEEEDVCLNPASSTTQ